MIKIIVPSVMTQEGHFVLGQQVSCSSALEAHLVDIGSAINLETKVLQPSYEKKSERPSSQLSQQDKVSQKKTQSRHTRKPKS